MSLPILLSVFAIPSISIPFVYLAGKKSPKAAAIFVAALALLSIALVFTTIPSIQANGFYKEDYTWIPTIINTNFTLYLDGMSASIALISLVLIFVASIYSVNYMAGKKNLAAYYALLCMLGVGVIGLFLTSNMILFYFCWELMLVPAYFIVGEWGYRNSYKSALKLFIFTHAGAVFVLLGIGATYWITNGATDMFTAQQALLTAANTDVAKWILVAMTAGFAVKMAVFPVHMWLPDAHSEAPAPMSAILSGIIISAGAYAILRMSFGMVFPAVGITFGTDFLHVLTIFGIVTAFFGSLLSLVATDIKRVIAYSSIAHMGYIMFGLSLFPVALASGNAVLLASATSIAIVGTILHIITHAVSKGLFFLTAGGVMHQTEERDIRKMGGLASKMPFSAVSGTIAALSIAGAPPLACFISEFLIFVGAFQIIQTDPFYIIPTALMLIATVFSLAYALRFVSKVFLGSSKDDPAVEAGSHDAHGGHTAAPEVKESEHGHKIVDIPNYMKFSLAILVVLVVLIGIYPTFFMQLIQTVTFGQVLVA
jgi:NADH-quinone oxidoreductase subunit M